MDGRVHVELHLPHRRVIVRTLSELPEFGDELDLDGVTFTVADVRLDEGLLPMILLAGVIGPPVLVGAAGWHRAPEPKARRPGSEAAAADRRRSPLALL